LKSKNGGQEKEKIHDGSSSHKLNHGHVVMAGDRWCSRQLYHTRWFELRHGTIVVEGKMKWISAGWFDSEV
jgi:hypothetical protein